MLRQVKIWTSSRNKSLLVEPWTSQMSHPRVLHWLSSRLSWMGMVTTATHLLVLTSTSFMSSKALKVVGIWQRAESFSTFTPSSLDSKLIKWKSYAGTLLRCANSIQRSGRQLADKHKQNPASCHPVFKGSSRHRWPFTVRFASSPVNTSLISQ